MNLYVGNLPYRMTEDALRQEFEQYGQVASCTIIMDKATGQSKGFGFLEMPTAEEAQAAITGLNGREVQGRRLNVNEARPRENGGGGGGFRGADRGGDRGGARPQRNDRW
ncbi:MAG: RNA recognition motif domain-containing protein [Thermoanaerobaculia bacterium]